MNAAVRAVVRTAVAEHLDIYIIHEGFLGLVDGGQAFVPVGTRDVSGILHQGGTVIGTARSEAFRTRDGRRRAVRHLVERGIDALVVIGGDGSLTGASTLHHEWPGLLEELVDAGEIPRERADRHATLRLVGIVGSIDNDMLGIDMTIGADTALHRITEAVGAIHSTAASHQRSFVIEVMGRNCGYLALMAGLATGADWIFIPEHPPASDDWRQVMRTTVREGRRLGRRQNLVIVAEGARDRFGAPISSQEVQQVLSEGLGEDVRVTILGHVQRGGAPSASDRLLATRCGYHAVHELLGDGPQDEPRVVGIRGNRIVSGSLRDAVTRTRAVGDHLAAGEFDEALHLRGGSFRESFETLRTLVRTTPSQERDEVHGLRLGLLHGGGPAPGMNTTVRAAVRAATDGGHTVVGFEGGFPGLRDGVAVDLDWMSVTGWVSHGGAELGTSRAVPDDDDLAQIARQVRAQRLDGLLVIGGFDAYRGADRIRRAVAEHPELSLPIVCVPASISNDLPATEVTIGADTALNSIITNLDRIKQTGVASRRVFVVEVMGKDSGYLALASGLASGAERIYTPEEGITLDGLSHDVDQLRAGFREGKRLGLIIRGEHADRVYTTPFMWALFSKEGDGYFDVRQAILGHLQQGGDPSPLDRIQGTRLASLAVHHLIEQARRESPVSAMSGIVEDEVRFTPLEEFSSLLDPSGARRPITQHWRSLRPIADTMAAPSDD